MELEGPQLAAGFALLVGSISFWRAFRLQRAIADHATARIRSAPQGYVELAGRAQPMDGEPVVAPLSGLPCCWYRYRVEERDGDGKWRVVDRGLSDALFLLEDGTGRCVVDPDGADVVKASGDTWLQGQTPSALAGREHGLPRWARALSVQAAGGASYRYHEQRILPGEELHALGLLRTVGGADGGPEDQRAALAERLEEWKRDPARMALFDRDGDGRIDAQEWEAARRAAQGHLARERLARAAEPDTLVLGNPGDAGRPFILSTVSEAPLLSRLRRRSVLAAVAALSGFVYLVHSLG